MSGFEGSESKHLMTAGQVEKGAVKFTDSRSSEDGVEVHLIFDGVKNGLSKIVGCSIRAGASVA